MERFNTTYEAFSTGTDTPVQSGDHAKKAIAMRLLGPFEVFRHEKRITSINYEKARALLTYLVVEFQRPQLREKLALMFWPDVPLENARTSLRQALATIRRALEGTDRGEPLFSVTRQTVQFIGQESCSIDLFAFFSQIAPTACQDPQCGSCLQTQKERAELLHGEFLEGCSLQGASEYNQWLGEMRERVRNRAFLLTKQLSSCYAKIGDLENAIVWLKSSRNFDRWNEEIARQLMCLYQKNGQRNKALTYYQHFRQSLEQELGAVPESETQKLFHQLRATI